MTDEAIYARRVADESTGERSKAGPLPIYFLMIHDFYTKRLIHPVYLIGVAAMLTMRLILPLGSSHAWQSIAAVITALYRATLG